MKRKLSTSVLWKSWFDGAMQTPICLILTLAVTLKVTWVSLLAVTEIFELETATL